MKQIMGVIMEQIIQIVKGHIGEESKDTVDARELYGFLEVKSRFNDWIRNRIIEYGFTSQIDYVTRTKNLVTGGQRVEYFISLDMAKELSMVERNEKGKRARQYFIECEKRSKVLAIPTNLHDALILAAELERKRLETEEQLMLAAPKAAALDRLSTVTGDLNITDTAKTLKTGPRRLFDFMSRNQWIYKRGGKGEWIGYQDKIQQGLIRHSEFRYKGSDETERLVTRVYVTTKGLAKLSELMEKAAQ